MSRTVFTDIRIEKYFPNALVIGKVFFNTDIREHGSGNLGGTNAGRTLGAKAGVAVA
ncbi:glycerol-3-phosphate acyltransferase, partial [Erysipelothrix rhusiopathiae]|nr:glycerol-3-phosphate acyltransferase [Erysipelothrix rhusiopathiae]